MIKKCVHHVLVLGLLLVSGLSQAALMKKDIKDNSLFIAGSGVSAPARLGILEIAHDGEGLSVIESSGKVTRIPNRSLSKELRRVSQRDLKGFVDSNNYLFVSRSDTGEFSLQDKTRGLGGGPTGGLIVYWIVKGIGYAGIGAAVVASAALGAKVSRPSTAAPGVDHALIHGDATGTMALAVIGYTGAFAKVEAAATVCGIAAGMTPSP